MTASISWQVCTLPKWTSTRGSKLDLSSFLGHSFAGPGVMSPHTRHTNRVLPLGDVRTSGAQRDHFGFSVGSFGIYHELNWDGVLHVFSCSVVSLPERVPTHDVPHD